jgi:predicted RNA-binding Zn-ribbon protein involved in translation (DUF1610 family)
MRYCPICEDIVTSCPDSASKGMLHHKGGECCHCGYTLESDEEATLIECPNCGRKTCNKGDVEFAHALDDEEGG